MEISLIKKFLKQIALIMTKEKDHLILEDSIVGDGDLGLTMSDGFNAAYKAIKNSKQNDAGLLLYYSGKTMGSAVPSTMGTLMASGLMQAGKALRGKTDLSRIDIITLFSSFLDGVQHLGKAKEGEKTFIDGFAPGLRALQSSIEKPLKESAKDAKKAANQGYLSTKGKIAIHGRAATRGEASRKLLDPGALVASYILEAFYNSID